MPSDTVVPEAVLGALGRAHDAFRSSLVASSEELRGMLHGSGSESPAERLRAELGPFAAGRIDAGRLAEVLDERSTLTEDALEVVRRAADVLDEVLDAAETPVVVEVPDGADLRDAVRDALTDLGRAFGAARAARLARSGAFRPERDERLFGGVPFRGWTLAERRLAPPLVVRVDARDLLAGGLADFMDGALHLTLVVRGAAPPAPLARLVTPGVMVVQTTDAEGLAPLAAFGGPAVAALFEETGPVAGDGTGVVEFVHDPRLGAYPWQRLSMDVAVDALRELLERRAWTRRSAKEDLEHLVEMATVPEGAGRTPGEEDAPGAPEPTTGADRLAAWLLAKTDLEDA